eukprot:2977348-Amphidinium_carterae.1
MEALATGKHGRRLNPWLSWLEPHLADFLNRSIQSMVTGQVRNFSWVLDGKLAGCAAPYRLGNIAYLWDQGARAILSLTEDGIEKLVADHGDVNASREEGLDKMSLLHIPVQDFTPPSQEQLKEG